MTIWNHQLALAARRSFQGSNSEFKTQLKHCSRRNWKSSLSPIFDDKERNDIDESSMEPQKRALEKLLAQHSTVAGKDDSRRRAKLEVHENNNRTVKAEEYPKEKASPTKLTYSDEVVMPVTSLMHLVTPQEDTPRGIWPIFRVMDEDGSFRDGKTDGHQLECQALSKSRRGMPLRQGENSRFDSLREKLKKETPIHTDIIDQSALLAPSVHPYPDIESQDTLLRAYTHMVRLREMDKILQNAQRQGRISFYMTCHGEEAIHIGAAAALELKDTVLAQYREAGLLMWRGFTLNQFTDQCFSNCKDLGKGRQMPIHYGSRALNYQTISSPLGTQIPQAAGAGYRLKLAKKDAVAVCFFGDGCASTADFHAGLNFAATLKAPVIFFCRNNGFAISTPVTDQYVGDGIVSRAPGYGIAAIRVDGNDIFAVHEVVRESRKYALEHEAPVLIEAMTYRQGHHSTSDDSFRYRSAKEVQRVADNHDPIARLQKFMLRNGQLTDDDFAAIENREKMAVIEAMREAECKPKPPLEALFTDVYHMLPPSLREQERQLNEHLSKYPKEYQL